MKTNWTHEKVKITDVRKLKSDKYALYVDIKEIDTPLFINARIFEGCLASYYFKHIFTREDVLNVKWNMYITKGYYIKIQNEEIEEITREDSQKYYISFLEIAGELGTFKTKWNEK